MACAESALIALNRPDPDADGGSRQLLLLFGHGLVGRAILRHVCCHADIEINEFPFSWRAPDEQQAAESRAIAHWAASHTRMQVAPSASPVISRIDVIWSAGAGGFASTTEQLAGELRTFQRVITLWADLRRLPGVIRHTLHLLSSAGGLFEAQRNIDDASAPQPMRPYGHLKREQEQILSAASTGAACCIYRPSTVYGFAGHKSRQGLIATLLMNGVRGSVSTIFGTPDTLRDYVYVDDIGRFIADRLSLRCRESSFYTLASARPTAIREILEMIETLTGRKLYVNFLKSPSNAEHQAFRARAIPTGFHPRELRTGIYQTRLKILDFFSHNPVRSCP